MGGEVERYNKHFQFIETANSQPNGVLGDTLPISLYSSEASFCVIEISMTIFSLPFLYFSVGWKLDTDEKKKKNRQKIVKET